MSHRNQGHVAMCSLWPLIRPNTCTPSTPVSSRLICISPSSGPTSSSSHQAHAHRLCNARWFFLSLVSARHITRVLTPFPQSSFGCRPWFRLLRHSNIWACSSPPTLPSLLPQLTDSSFWLFWLCRSVLVYIYN